MCLEEPRCFVLVSNNRRHVQYVPVEQLELNCIFFHVISGYPVPVKEFHCFKNLPVLLYLQEEISGNRLPLDQF